MELKNWGITLKQDMKDMRTEDAFVNSDCFGKLSDYTYD